MTMASIKKITDYDDGFNLYSMKVCYDYNLDRIISGDIDGDQQYINRILNEAFPFLPVKLQAPKFGCSAFSSMAVNGSWLMGRNYDFRNNTSSMMIYCNPKKGYKSISFADLNNIKANHADENIKSRLVCLASPFAVLDGMNEKGVSIAVLTLDSAPTQQHSEKPDIATCLAIRLVLDRAASTKEAVKLLDKYDMYAASGRDYHFYICDSDGDCRVVEYDPHSPTREMVVSQVEAVTNFFAIYADKVKPDQKNGIYGHGKERYDRIMKILDEDRQVFSEASAWKALKAASQEPDSKDVTSNTQWSIVYNNTELTVDFVLRRKWNDKFHYTLMNK